MNKIKAILAVVVRFIVGLFKEQKEEEVKGAKRVQEVLSHFEDDLQNLRFGLEEMSLEDRQLFEQIEVIKFDRAALETSRNQGEKLLKGLKALLGE
jgi:hypothetical protein